MASISIDLTGNPWIVTTGATALPANLVSTTFPFMPRRIQWISNTASAGDAVILEDAAGRKVFEEYATGANWVGPEHRPVAKELAVGVQVTTFAGGTLYIWM